MSRRDMFKLEIKDFCVYPKIYGLDNLKKLDYDTILEVGIYSIVRAKINNIDYYACFSYSSFCSCYNYVHPFIFEMGYDSFIEEFKNFYNENRHKL